MHLGCGHLILCVYQRLCISLYAYQSTIIHINMCLTNGVTIVCHTPVLYRITESLLIETYLFRKCNTHVVECKQDIGSIIDESQRTKLPHMHCYHSDQASLWGGMVTCRETQISSSHSTTCTNLALFGQLDACWNRGVSPNTTHIPYTMSVFSFGHGVRFNCISQT